MSISDAIAYLKRTDQPGAEAEDLVVSHDDSPVYTHFGDGLICCYLIDRADQFEYVLNRDLESSVETVVSVDEIGRQNLAALAASRLEVREYKSTFVALMGGNFEASLLLIDELWDTTLSNTVAGDYVAAIPARDILAFCDSESPAGIAELHALLNRVDDTFDHPLSQKLYRRSGRRWEVYDA